MSLAVGLISGTSMDGIDAALVQIPEGPQTRPRLLAFRSTAYSPALRSALGDLVAGGGLARLARLNVVVGEVFADAVLELLSEAAVEAPRVRCIGSHGQTVIHLPRLVPVAGRRVNATLQIGAPAVIAARTGIVTVADFRPMDMALGGQGAPLVPLLDWRLYQHPDRGRVLLNLGGIANLTALPAGTGLEGLLAFDTGPANILIDTVARRRGLPGGIDRDGDTAAAGRVCPELLAHLGRNPFLGLPPPKSADAAELVDWFDGAASRHEPLSTADLLATLTRHTAATVAAALSCWISPGMEISEILVSGGGAHNRTLMQELRDRVAPTALGPVPVDGGIPGDAKEAVAFALLAVETLEGRPGNVASATGARAAAVLGAIVRPPTPGAVGGH